MSNHWQLYESFHGWEEAAHRLDVACASALETMESSIQNGVAPAKASVTAFRTVLNLMEYPDVSRFGADDREPRHVLAVRINRRLLDNHQNSGFLNQYGDLRD